MKNARRALTLFAVISLLAGGGLTQAAQNQPMYAPPDTPQQQEQVPLETYHYGMKLDIARVLFITDTRDVCGVVPSVMHYEDRTGTRRALEYLIHGGGCADY